MKRLTTGIMAHVDAGKTTLTEAMLYLTGNIRRLGRVDHGDAFLDTQELERERGITIYAKQAILRRGDLELTLVDTPGHVDFSAETERALQVLDCAILVVSAADGVQGHTETLWQLLEEAGVPVFLFVNKMDQPNEGKAAILKQLEGRLGHGFVDMTDPEARGEGAALCSEELMERYLSGEEFTQEELAALVVQRQLFPVYFGSALQVEGVEELLDLLAAFLPEGPQLFPEDMVTDQPERQVCAEIIREKLLLCLDKEIPHGTAVEITRFSARDNEIIDLDATIYCEKASHKGIIIGKKGSMLKKISTQAREDMEAFMGAKVYLETWVKVKENWRDNVNLIHNFGYTED